MPETPPKRKPPRAAGWQSGAEGVFLVCAELTRRGYIVSPTSRSAKGADILATSGDCRRAFTIQVKTNTKTENFWLVDKPEAHASPSLVYVLVCLNDHKKPPDYWIVRSADIRAGTTVKGEWCSFKRDDTHKDNWTLFECSAPVVDPRPGVA